MILDAFISTAERLITPSLEHCLADAQLTSADFDDME